VFAKPFTQDRAKALAEQITNLKYRRDG